MALHPQTLNQIVQQVVRILNEAGYSTTTEVTGHGRRSEIHVAYNDTPLGIVAVRRDRTTSRFYWSTSVRQLQAKLHNHGPQRPLFAEEESVLRAS